MTDTLVTSRRMRDANVAVAHLTPAIGIGMMSVPNQRDAVLQGAGVLSHKVNRRLHSACVS
jgi:hypothetical protein